MSTAPRSLRETYEGGTLRHSAVERPLGSEVRQESPQAVQNELDPDDGGEEPHDFRDDPFSRQAEPGDDAGGQEEDRHGQEHVRGDGPARASRWLA